MLNYLQNVPFFQKTGNLALFGLKKKIKKGAIKPQSRLPSAAGAEGF